MAFPPERIICLTEETVEQAGLLEEDSRSSACPATRYGQRGCEKRSAFPLSQVRISQKYCASASSRFHIFGFAGRDRGEPGRQGVQVHAFNQRSVAGILDMVRMAGAIVGKTEKGTLLAERLSRGLEAIRTEAQKLPRRPRVYFEEIG